MYRQLRPVRLGQRATKNAEGLARGLSRSLPFWDDGRVLRARQGIDARGTSATHQVSSAGDFRRRRSPHSTRGWRTARLLGIWTIRTRHVSRGQSRLLQHQLQVSPPHRRLDVEDAWACMSHCSVEIQKSPRGLPGKLNISIVKVSEQRRNKFAIQLLTVTRAGSPSARVALSSGRHTRTRTDGRALNLIGRTAKTSDSVRPNPVGLRAIGLVPEHEDGAHHLFIGLAHLAAMSLDFLELSGRKTHLDFLSFDGKSAKLRLVSRHRPELAILADLLDSEVRARSLILESRTALEIAFGHLTRVVRRLENLALNGFESEIANLSNVPRAAGDRYCKDVH